MGGNAAAEYAGGGRDAQRLPLRLREMMNPAIRAAPVAMPIAW